MSQAQGSDSGGDTVIARFQPFVPTPLPAYVFCGVYLILLVSFLGHIVKRRDWWALALPIGCLIQAVGYVNKVRFHSNPTFGLYFTGDLFVQIAPVSYLAFNYILLGRLAQNLESSSEIEKSRYRLVGISPRHVATLFVWSDVITLLVQVAGGLMKIADNVAKLGHYIGLLGIALQLLSYIVFILLLRRLHTSCNDLETTHLGRNVRILVNVIWASSFWIVVRLVYRVIELAPGMSSPISASEACFYILDALPLVLAISPYVLFWPPRLVPLAYTKKYKTSESTEYIGMQA